MMDETNWHRHYAPQTNNMQRTNTSISSKGTKKGSRGSNLRLQCIYRLYIQTDWLEKVKGWHSQSVEYGDTRGLHGQMRL